MVDSLWKRSLLKYWDQALWQAIEASEAARQAFAQFLAVRIPDRKSFYSPQWTIRNSKSGTIPCFDCSIRRRRDSPQSQARCLPLSRCDDTRPRKPCRGDSVEQEHRASVCCLYESKQQRPQKLQAGSQNRILDVHTARCIRYTQSRAP